jgi:hypothetical protein
MNFGRFGLINKLIKYLEIKEKIKELYNMLEQIKKMKISDIVSVLKEKDTLDLIIIMLTPITYFFRLKIVR